MEDITFPDCFPSAPKACSDQSTSFFTCLLENSQKQSPDDKMAGERGLKLCLAEKKLYEECVARFNASNANIGTKNNSTRRFRVQEEYQLKQSKTVP